MSPVAEAVRARPLALEEAPRTPALGAPKKTVAIHRRVLARVARARTGFSYRSAIRRAVSLTGKRCIDIVVAGGACLVLLPVMALVALLVVSTSPGPALFWSTRVGYLGRPFEMPKFRTLRAGTAVQPREALTIAESDFTPVGKFLRRTGLDELPQLFSVLKGDMSVIGPRPLLAADPAARERLKFPSALMVRPGISGLAQVSGRNSVSPRRKARLDALYSRAASLRVDFVLMLKTVQTITSGRGFL